MIEGQALTIFAFLSLIMGMNTALAFDDRGAPADDLTMERKGGHPVPYAYEGSGRSVTVFRGSPQSRVAAETDSPTPEPRMVRAGVIGTGRNLWYVGPDGRIHACWLSGTGYVNSLKVVCTR